MLHGLSLDSRDNQNGVFLQYFVAALQNIDPAIGQSVQQQFETSSLPELSKSLTSIVNDIVSYQKEIFIVLDDYHFIQSKEVQQFLEVLINLAPSNFHLIVSSRVLPDFPIITKKRSYRYPAIIYRRIEI